MDLLNIAAGQYAAASNELSGYIGAISESEYIRKRHAVETCRADAEAASAALQLHKAEHGC